MAVLEWVNAMRNGRDKHCLSRPFGFQGLQAGCLR